MTPQEMEQAIVRNLPDKTGRSLEEWFEALSESGISDTRELKAWLKGTHGVGHFQAQTIVKHYRLA